MAEHDGLATTASFGIALYSDDGLTSAAQLRAADRALYEAKLASSRPSTAGSALPISSKS